MKNCLLLVLCTSLYAQEPDCALKSLVRPVNGACITSRFGMRMHPILHCLKMHLGVDYGAPEGTPIYAAGPGIIVEAGPKGEFGNFVRIAHTRTFATTYSHASRFADGIKPGVRVKRGQVIAYVGSTGLSTGPHLHFEILVKNQPVDPVATNYGTSPKNTD